jgi:hypothetical protein
MTTAFLYAAGSASGQQLDEEKVADWNDRLVGTGGIVAPVRLVR